MQLLFLSFVAMGVLLLSTSLFPTRKIFDSRYSNEGGWKILFGLILLFIIGYIAYMFLLWGSAVGVIEGVVSAILFSGACFVVLVTRMSLVSIQKLQSVVEKEHYNALHDPLTQLPNRQYLFERIEAFLANDSSFAVVVTDLDRFKDINDTLGHFAGDEALCITSQRLLKALGEQDFLSRLGGDEFALVLSHSDEDELRKKIKRIRESIQEPLKICETDLLIDMSLGVALFPGHGKRAEDLLKCADIAMYHAKRGQLGSAFYQDGLDRYSEQRLHLTAYIKRAMFSEEFSLYYQPLVAICKPKGLYGVEALLRWESRGKVTRSPDEFIPIIEQLGLMSQLTEFVFDSALASMSRWRKQGLKLQLHINLSLKDIENFNLPKIVEMRLEKYQFQASMLTLEITESAMMADTATVTHNIRALKEIGVEITVDDFGTGFSSLSRLRDLPVCNIKIDKSFITALSSERKDEMIVRSTISLAHNMNYRVTAEGVENKEALSVLKKLGCDLVQGFLIAAPMPEIEFGGWARKNSARFSENILA